jgi:hypothetical protein
MICPKCQSDTAVRNGSGRGYCRAGDHTFRLPPAALNDADNLPDSVKLRGTSTLTDLRTGEQLIQWVKTTAEESALRHAMVTLVESFKEEVKGLAKPVKMPKGRRLADSLSAYMIGDAHFGAYAWAAETGGEDFDTAIASADLRAAIDLLVAGAPESETGYLVDVGDYLHADNRSNMTPASGNLLDVDTRYQRVIRIASAAMRYCIGRMLEKHKFVKVFVTPGNHNPDSAGWMAAVMEAYYRREKRVEIETSPSKFYYQRFGKTLIGITHGDKIKLDQLPSIMAHDRAEDWGQTEHRYWWTGHIHHTKHQEYRGCTVEAFNTLAAGDAWHAANGYRAMRQMQRIDIDRTFGIYNRGIVSVGMLRAQTR